MDQEKEILKKSKRRIQKLKLLSKFFGQTELINIIIKTEIIQSYFETKSELGLDFNKLELFHLQYTDSLLVLLDKIKKQKEANILTIYKEIDANKDYIDSFVDRENGGRNFNIDRKYQNGYVSEFLENIYSNLTDVRKPIDYKKIRELSNNYAVEYYRTTAKMEFLISLPNIKCYEFENVDVERKLLGKLNSNHFKIRFLCGYNINNQIFELFKITDIDEDFIWNLQINEFYMIPEDISVLLDKSPNTSSKKSFVTELNTKNKELEERAKILKTTLPDQVISILEKYKENLENQEIINQLLSIDEELNILNSMLTLNLNNKLQ
ncbi:hypothetical protein [Kaistella sp.]|uniref:hypothetical protein n=1 Tax=Kaistella sp. TaxID=2782235 RepID=UPI00359F98E8